MFNFIVGFFLIKCDNRAVFLCHFCIIYDGICEADLVENWAVPNEASLVWMDEVGDLIDEL